MSSSHIKFETRPDYKAETVKQWNNDPCGADAAGALETGSEEFFARIDQNRYGEYAHCGADVSGIDLTPRHLELATERFRRAGVPADLRLGDAETLPYADGSFDVVYSFGVLHHTPNAKAAVSEIHRVLRPGGTLIVAMYHKWSLPVLKLALQKLLISEQRAESWNDTLSRIEHRKKSDAKTLVRLYTRSSLRRLLRDFKTVSVMSRLLTARDHALKKSGFPTWAIEAAQGYIGWYLIAEATRW